MIFNIFSPLRRRGRREKIFSLAVERPARENFLGFRAAGLNLDIN
jgi:hypothetical protein